MNDSHLHPTRGGRFYNAELRWDGVPTLRRAVQMLRAQAARTPSMAGRLVSSLIAGLREEFVG